MAGRVWFQESFYGDQILTLSRTGLCNVCPAPPRTTSETLALFFTTATIIHFSHVSPTILRKFLTVCFTLCLLPSDTFSTQQAECPLKTQNVTPTMVSHCSSNIISLPCHRFSGPACSSHYTFYNHTLTSDHNPAAA